MAPPRLGPAAPGGSWRRRQQPLGASLAALVAVLAPFKPWSPPLVVALATPSGGRAAVEANASSAERSETGAARRPGQCSPLPRCACYDRADDEAPCHEARLFERLLTWMQEGIDRYVPPELTAGLPRLVEAIGLQRPSLRGVRERAVVALRGLRAGDLLMRLPLQRLMHGGVFKGAPTGEPAAAAGPTAGSGSPLGARASLAERLQQGLTGNELFTFVAPQTWLALYLLEQKRLGAASQWAPYMDLLPDEFPSVPLFLSEADWAWLEGSLFVDRVERHREGLTKQYETVEKLVPGFSRNYSIDDYLWARTAISSRVYGWAFPGLSKEFQANLEDFMVPLGDMMNHRSPKQVEWFFNATTHTLDYRALENVSAGAELLISYGGKCNSHYLLHYGFTVPNVSKREPPLSTVRVQMDLDEDVPDRALREKRLLKSRMLDSGGRLPPEVFELKLGAFKEGAEAMLGYARLLSLPQGGEFDQRLRDRSCRAFSTPPRCERPLSLDSERAALGRCAAALAAALAAYPTSLGEDEALLPTLAGLPRMLVTLRYDEKVVLRWWRRFFGVALEVIDAPSMDALERRAEDEFGNFSSETRYMKVTLAALLQVERRSGFEGAARGAAGVVPATAAAT